MVKLIKAGLSRYLHSKFFCVVSAVALTLSLVAGFKIGSDALLDDFCLFLPVIICPVIIIFSMGRELEAGAIRNKIICGYSREQIFLSELFIAFLVFNWIFILSSVPIFMMNRQYLVETLSSGFLITIYVVFYLLTLVTSVIGFIISCVSSNRIISAAVILLVIVALFMLGFQLSEKLSQPEFVYWNEYNEITLRENPNYIGGLKGTLLRFIHSINPFGQFFDSFNFLSPHIGTDTVIDFSSNEVSKISVSPLYSLGVIAFLTVSGFFVYRKKSFK